MFDIHGNVDNTVNSCTVLPPPIWYKKDVTRVMIDSRSGFVVRNNKNTIDADYIIDEG